MNCQKSRFFNELPPPRSLRIAASPTPTTLQLPPLPEHRLPPPKKSGIQFPDPPEDNLIQSHQTAILTPHYSRSSDPKTGMPFWHRKENATINDGSPAPEATGNKTHIEFYKLFISIMLQHFYQTAIPVIQDSD